LTKIANTFSQTDTIYLEQNDEKSRLEYLSKYKDSLNLVLSYPFPYLLVSGKEKEELQYIGTMYEFYNSSHTRSVRTTYWHNGNKRKEVCNSFDTLISKSEWFHDSITDWYLNGELKKIVKYKKGEPYWATNYYENGNIKDQTNKDTLGNYSFLSWWSNSNLKTRSNWNYSDSTSTWYYSENGKIMAKHFKKPFGQSWNETCLWGKDNKVLYHILKRENQSPEIIELSIEKSKLLKLLAKNEEIMDWFYLSGDWDVYR
jgi:hypothetical protein